MPGYKSTIIIIPEAGTGIIILTNKISYLNEELAGVIVDYLDLKKINWKEAGDNDCLKNFNFPWDDETDSISQLQSVIPGLALYKGRYEDKAYGKAVIFENGSEAILELSPSKKQLSGRLYYLDKNRLRIIFNDGFISPGEIVFTRDTGNRIKGFTLEIPSSDFHFKYLRFIKK
ncbi:MAG: hypothetical protein WKF97_18285 [Chitinophagaceae bacterium]